MTRKVVEYFDDGRTVKYVELDGNSVEYFSDGKIKKDGVLLGWSPSASHWQAKQNRRYH